MPNTTHWRVQKQQNELIPCNASGCDNYRYNLGRYCRTHAYKVYAYGHHAAESRGYGLRAKQYEPQVIRLLKLNQHKQGFKSASAFLGLLAEHGRIIPPGHRAGFVPSQLAQSEHYNHFNVLVRLVCLMLGDVIECYFLHEKHRNYLLSSHLCRVAKVKFPSPNQRHRAQMHHMVGGKLWGGIAPYLLNCANTIKRADEAKEREKGAQWGKLEYK